MSMVNHVAQTELIAREEAAKGSLEWLPVSPEHATTQSSGAHSPVVDTTSDCSNASTRPESIITSKGPSSPISILLEELLIMIFDEVTTSESSSCHCRSQRADWWQSSPRSLASVSRAWRAIVFACPLLWRHVHLTPIQPNWALKQQLHLSAPLCIHLTVHQWPFRSPIPSSGPFSVVALTAQLNSILEATDKKGTALSPASHRVESITINATESSTFLNFVLQTWTGRGSKFPALRRIALNGNVCGTWSRACFFDGKNAPVLERLELSNVVIAHDAYRLPWGIGQNLKTLVWAAPPHRHGSLIVSVACFHHIVSSFPNLSTLELHGHVAALEFATLESLQASGITPLRHVRDLRVSGRAFPNASAAFMLFYLLPSLEHLAVRGRACSGPLGQRTVTHALQALVCLPKLFGWPIVLPNLKDLELDCIDGDECEEWKTWCTGELEVWRQWQEIMAKARTESDATRVQMHVEIEDSESVGTDEDLDA